MWGTENNPKYFFYFEGTKYLELIRDFAGEDRNICIYSSKDLDSDGSLPGQNGGGLSTVLEVVISVCVFVIAFLIGLFIFFFFCRNHSEKDESELPLSPIPEPSFAA